MTEISGDPPSFSSVDVIGDRSRPDLILGLGIRENPGDFFHGLARRDRIENAFLLQSQK